MSFKKEESEARALQNGRCSGQSPLMIFHKSKNSHLKEKKATQPSEGESSLEGSPNSSIFGGANEGSKSNKIGTSAIFVKSNDVSNLNSFSLELDNAQESPLPQVQSAGLTSNGYYYKINQKKPSVSKIVLPNHKPPLPSTFFYSKKSNEVRFPRSQISGLQTARTTRNSGNQAESLDFDESRIRNSYISLTSGFSKSSRYYSLSKLKEEAKKAEDIMLVQKSENLRKTMESFKFLAEKKQMEYKQKFKAAQCIQKVFKGFYVRKNWRKIIEKVILENTILKNTREREKNQGNVREKKRRFDQTKESAAWFIMGFLKERVLLRREREKYHVKKAVVSAIVKIQRRLREKNETQLKNCEKITMGLIKDALKWQCGERIAIMTKDLRKKMSKIRALYIGHKTRQILKSSRGVMMREEIKELIKVTEWENNKDLPIFQQTMLRKKALIDYCSRLLTSRYWRSEIKGTLDVITMPNRHRKKWAESFNVIATSSGQSQLYGNSHNGGMMKGQHNRTNSYGANQTNNVQAYGVSGNNQTSDIRKCSDSSIGVELRGRRPNRPEDGPRFSQSLLNRLSFCSQGSENSAPNVHRPVNLAQRRIEGYPGHKKNAKSSFSRTRGRSKNSQHSCNSSNLKNVKSRFLDFLPSSKSKSPGNTRLGTAASFCFPSGNITRYESKNVSKCNITKASIVEKPKNEKKIFKVLRGNKSSAVIPSKKQTKSARDSKEKLETFGLNMALQITASGSKITKNHSTPKKKGVQSPNKSENPLNLRNRLKNCRKNLKIPNLQIKGLSQRVQNSKNGSFLKKARVFPLESPTFVRNRAQTEYGDEMPDKESLITKVARLSKMNDSLRKKSPKKGNSRSKFAKTLEKLKESPKNSETRPQKIETEEIEGLKRANREKKQEEMFSVFLKKYGPKVREKLKLETTKYIQSEIPTMQKQSVFAIGCTPLNFKEILISLVKNK